jgi:hypothetical protein
MCLPIQDALRSQIAAATPARQPKPLSAFLHLRVAISISSDRWYVSPTIHSVT